MKKIQILLAVVALATMPSQIGRAQVCSTNDSLIAQASAPVGICSDNYELFYGAGAFTPTIPVNFIFYMPTDTTIPTRFKKYNSATCDTILAFLNDSINNFLAPTKPLPNPAPFISGARVRFVKKSVQKILSSSFNNGWDAAVASADKDAINIVYNHGPCGNAQQENIEFFLLRVRFAYKRHK